VLPRERGTRGVLPREHQKDFPVTPTGGRRDDKGPVVRRYSAAVGGGRDTFALVRACASGELCDGPVAVSKTVSKRGEIGGCREAPGSVPARHPRR